MTRLCLVRYIYTMDTVVGTSVHTIIVAEFNLPCVVGVRFLYTCRCRCRIPARLPRHMYMLE
jgi:hypothetical protein